MNNVMSECISVEWYVYVCKVPQAAITAPQTPVQSAILVSRPSHGSSPTNPLDLITAEPFLNGCNEVLRRWRLNGGGMDGVIKPCKHSNMDDWEHNETYLTFFLFFCCKILSLGHIISSFFYLYNSTGM